MIAIILAGGKSSRLNRGTYTENEKALITIGKRGNQKRLLDLVVEPVRESNVEDFFVAITKNTPKTEEYCKLANYKTVETPGGGYHEDLWYLLPRYPEFVSVACDIPFLRSKHINAIIDAYRLRRISVTGAIPLDMLPESITPSYTFEHKGKELVSCGINVVTNSKDSIPFIFDDPLLAINVNTDADLSVARSMLE
ncbi:MAG TPA: NTP transferase domain-containing protein [Candidatus Bathyarchaeia archaeon]|nr:NTP transferase domain-containing protein [Candidatus Bathyarchaeia archaeon]